MALLLNNILGSNTTSGNPQAGAKTPPEPITVQPPAPLPVQPSKWLTQLQAPTQKAQNEPNYSSNEYVNNVLKASGFSDDDVAKWKAPYDPTKDTPYLTQLYKDTNKEPDPIDPSVAKRRQTIAGVADAVSMLAQMFSASRGAHMKERTFGSLKYADTKNEADNQNYIKLKKLYQDGLMQARLKDYANGQARHQELRKLGQEALNADKKRRAEQKKHEDDLAYKREKDATDKANNDRNYALKVAIFDADQKHKDKQLALARYRAQISASRASASRGSSGASTARKGYTTFHVPLVGGAQSPLFKKPYGEIYLSQADKKALLTDMRIPKTEVRNGVRHYKGTYDKNGRFTPTIAKAQTWKEYAIENGLYKDVREDEPDSGATIKIKIPTQDGKGVVYKKVQFFSEDQIIQHYLNEYSQYRFQYDAERYNLHKDPNTSTVDDTFNPDDYAD